MKKQENKRGEAGERPWLRATLAVLRGGLLACGAAVLLLLAAACLISTGAVGERWLDGVVPGACVAGSLVGGLYAVGRAGRPALAVGLGTGITLFLLLLCVGLLAYDAAGLERDGAGTLCACLCGGGLAGVLALPRKKKRRR